MKIGIDTFGCDHARSGLGAYILNFIANIPDDREFSFGLFGSEIDRYTYSGDRDIPFVSANVPDSLEAERLWHLFGAGKFTVRNGYDAVLYPAAEKVVPVSFRRPGIVIANSIISSSQAWHDRMYRFQLRRGLVKAEKIIAASEFIKNDLVSLGIDGNRISVIHNGIDHKLFYPSMEADTDVVEIKPFAIKRPYFIYGSRLAGPEKKHLELIKAFSLFKRRTGLPHRLVLSGSGGAYTESVHRAAFESPAASDIFLTGYFPHESFPQLYAGADACVFPSVNEGVGLPVLESMACGIPVICSSSGALPEIGGDVPLYFDSDNVEEMAECMEKVVTDSVLRERMVSAGLERAAEFSWEKTVRITLDAVAETVSAIK